MVPSLQIRQFLFLFLIFGLFGLISWNLCLFIPALLGAYTLYVLLRTPTLYLSEVRQWNRYVAAGAMMLVSFTLILFFMGAAVGLLGTKVKVGFDNSQQLLQAFQTGISNIENRLGLQLLTPERVQSISVWGVQEASTLINATLIGLLLLLVTYFILWFMLTEAQQMEKSFFIWLPLKHDNVEYVRKELNILVYSNAIGIPLLGIMQALAGLIGYSLVGVEDLWFWVCMTFLAGMVPFLGVMLAFLPLALLLYSKGLNAQAIFIVVYGAVVIGSVDNLARMWLMNKIGHTHPLVTLFGVIIGLNLFGFIGFIFGPILISMFLLLLKIYTKEFK